MRKSQKVLLGAAGLLVAGIVVVAAMSRIALSQLDPEAVDREREARTSGAGRVIRRYELDGFRGLDIEGAWRVSVVRGDAWQVEIAYPEIFEDEVDVLVRGNYLRLERNASRRWRWWGRNGIPITADIVMPDLTHVSAAGANELGFSGFEGARLEVDLAGAVRLQGQDGAYDTIDLSVAGASELDLRGIVATDARVSMAGASHVVLTMDGGVLSGSMAGAGSIDYYGTVSEQRVDVAGIGRVHRMD